MLLRLHKPEVVVQLQVGRGGHPLVHRPNHIRAAGGKQTAQQASQLSRWRSNYPEGRANSPLAAELGLYSTERNRRKICLEYGLYYHAVTHD